MIGVSNIGYSERFFGLLTFCGALTFNAESAKHQGLELFIYIAYSPKTQ